MMKSAATLVFAAAMAVIASGCQCCQPAERTPAVSTDQGDFIRAVVLASYRAQPAPSEQPEQSKEGQPKAETTGEDKEDQEPKPRAAVSYTAPSAAVRQAALLAITLATSELEGTSAVAGGGKELAESAFGNTAADTSSIFGRLGLTAPQPTVAGAVVSRPGLQEGPASGIGFASPFNLLTPQLNPLTGPTGRCSDLIRAGFFGGNSADCVRHFRPQ